LRLFPLAPLRNRTPGLRRLDDWAAFAADLVEPVEARIGVRLYQAGVAREMPFGVLTPPAGRIEEDGGRQIRPGKRRSSRTRSTAGRSVSCPLRAPAPLCRRHECARVRTYGRGSPRSAASGSLRMRPPGRRASRHQGLGGTLPVKRQMQVVFGEQHIGEQSRSGAPSTIGCEEPRRWVIDSHERQENFSRYRPCSVTGSTG